MLLKFQLFSVLWSPVTATFIYKHEKNTLIRHSLSLHYFHLWLFWVRNVCMCFLLAGFHFLCAYLQHGVSDSISFHIYLCGEHTKFSANSLWFTASRIFVLLLNFLSCVRDLCLFPCLHIILCISGYQSILHLHVCANTTLHSFL